MPAEPRVVDIRAAKILLSRLLARVAAGEEIVIAKAGKPVARLVPLEAKRPDRLKAERPARVLGTGRGQVWMAEDFDEPMSEEELKDWHG